MKQCIPVAALLAVITGPALAQNSVYTQTGQDNCTLVSEGEEGGGYSALAACAGHQGWTLFLIGDDHGGWSGYSQGDTEPAEMQYGGYVGNFGSFHSVVEWRTDQADAPYATIHRYNSTEFDSDGEPIRRSMLIVTALRPGEAIESCHAGYVDALQVTNANVQARLMADDVAPHIDCADHRPFRIDATMPSVAQLISQMH